MRFDTMLIGPGLNGVRYAGLAFVCTFLIFGCEEGAQTERAATITEVTLPLTDGCEPALDKAKLAFNEISSSTHSQLRLETQTFDVVSTYPTSLVGTVTLYQEGSWTELDGMSAEEYLKQRASEIAAECMPNSQIDVPFSQIPSLEKHHTDITRKGDLYLEYTSDGIRIFYNDATYASE